MLLLMLLLLLLLLLLHKLIYTNASPKQPLANRRFWSVGAFLLLLLLLMLLQAARFVL
jgi:hypothetical protein